MVPTENRGPGLGAADYVCSWLAPDGGPILRSGARGQVQPAHDGPHAGTGDLACSASFVLSQWHGEISAGARDVSSHAVTSVSGVVQSLRLAIPTATRLAPWPPFCGTDAPR